MSETATVKQYRLSWESVGGHFAAAMEMQHGKDCWPNLDWDDFEWDKTTRVDSESGFSRDQYETLKKWAETREQPVRNVTLEVREIQTDDEGWEPVL